MTLPSLCKSPNSAFVYALPPLQTKGILIGRATNSLTGNTLTRLDNPTLLSATRCNMRTTPTEHKTSGTSSNLREEKRTAIIVVDHGSKRQAANDLVFDIADKIRAKSTVPVFPAHMELATPNIADAVDSCAASDITHVIVVPFFLSPGRHATTDIPQLTEEAVGIHEGMSFEIRPPIGTHPAIIDVILDRAGLL